MKDRLQELQATLGVKYNPANGEQAVEVMDSERYPELMDVLNEVQEIRGWIDEMNERTQNMKSIYSNATFSTCSSLQSEMDLNITVFTGLGSKACIALKKFEEKLPKYGQNTLLFRIADVQHKTTKQLCTEALTNHNKFLLKYKESRMAVLQQQIKLTNQSITEEECESLLESNKVSIFVQNYESETREAQMLLRDVEDRHKELVKIENALKEVNNLFHQLSFMVHQQQEKIDTVEHFARQATDRVETGNRQLEKGITYHIKSNKKKFYIIICLSVVVLILLLILLI